MNEIVTVKLKRKELKCLVDFLLETLHCWSESGVEDADEEYFDQIVDVTCKLREALGEKDIIII